MDELIRLDRQLDEETKRGSSAEPYPIRVVALAVARFDIWARRCGVIVQDKSTLEDYRRWLDAYTRSWIVICRRHLPQSRGWRTAAGQPK